MIWHLAPLEFSAFGACAFLADWDEFVLELRCFLAGALPKFESLEVSDSLNLHSP